MTPRIEVMHGNQEGPGKPGPSALWGSENRTPDAPFAQVGPNEIIAKVSTVEAASSRRLGAWLASSHQSTKDVPGRNGLPLCRAFDEIQLGAQPILSFKAIETMAQAGTFVQWSSAASVPGRNALSFWAALANSPSSDGASPMGRTASLALTVYMKFSALTSGRMLCLTALPYPTKGSTTPAAKDDRTAASHGGDVFRAGTHVVPSLPPYVLYRAALKRPPTLILCRNSASPLPNGGHVDSVFRGGMLAHEPSPSYVPARNASAIPQADKSAPPASQGKRNSFLVFRAGTCGQRPLAGIVSKRRELQSLHRAAVRRGDQALDADVYVFRPGTRNHAFLSEQADRRRIYSPAVRTPQTLGETPMSIARPAGPPFRTGTAAYLCGVMQVSLVCSEDPLPRPPRTLAPIQRSRTSSKNLLITRTNPKEDPDCATVPVPARNGAASTCALRPNQGCMRSEPEHSTRRDLP